MSKLQHVGFDRVELRRWCVRTWKCKALSRWSAVLRVTYFTMISESFPWSNSVLTLLVKTI